MDDLYQSVADELKRESYHVYMGERHFMEFIMGLISKLIFEFLKEFLELETLRGDFQ